MQESLTAAFGGRHPRRANALQSPGRDQLFALSQRHDSVADRCDLSFDKRRIRFELRPDRSDHADVPGVRVGTAAAHRHLHGQASDAAFVERRHGLHADRHRYAWRWRRITRAFWSPPRSSVRGRRYFIRSPRGSPVWHRAAVTDWPSRYFRWEGTPAARSGRCSPPGSSFRTARRASPGLHWPPSSRSPCYGT